MHNTKIVIYTMLPTKNLIYLFSINICACYKYNVYLYNRNTNIIQL